MSYHLIEFTVPHKIEKLNHFNSARTYFPISYYLSVIIDQRNVR